MLPSLFAGITGLQAHQTMMDVVSNDIANVNTIGFKSSSVIFSDTLSQLVKSAGAATGQLDGVNPSQIGLGVQVGGISTNFTQGSAQNTGKATDLMIQGDGFFVTREGSDQHYTRAGSFSFDSSGTLVTPAGEIVQGWPAVNGASDTNGPATDIKIPANTQIPPTPSSKVTIGGNITNGSTTNPIVLGATAYDSAGNAHTLTATMTWNTTNNNYDVAVVDGTAGSTATAGTLAFTTAGLYDSANSTAPVVTLADGTTVSFDMSTATNYGGPSSLSVTAADGASAGNLQNFQIGTDGNIVGLFSNGQKLTLATMALANFNNPAGLQKIGDTEYSATTNTGLPQIGTAGSGGLGTLLGGALEMSNVDLASEFTNLIIAQRGFEANSKVITTSDTLLQDLVDIKR